MELGKSDEWNYVDVFSINRISYSGELSGNWKDYLTIGIPPRSKIAYDPVTCTYCTMCLFENNLHQLKSLKKQPVLRIPVYQTKMQSSRILGNPFNFQHAHRKCKYCRYTRVEMEHFSEYSNNSDVLIQTSHQDFLVADRFLTISPTHNVYNGVVSLCDLNTLAITAEQNELR